MTIEQIMQLGAMGYTKADIEAMDKLSPEQKEPEKKEPEGEKLVTLTSAQLELLMGKQEVTKEEPEEKKEPANATFTDEQFEKFMQGLRANGANIDVPKKVDLDEKLADHFASLFGASKDNKEK